MATTIAEFRKQYPQYDRVDDDTLARKLHEKYYQHVTYEEFASRFMPSGAQPQTDVSVGDRTPPDVPVGGRTSEYGEQVIASERRPPVPMDPPIESYMDGPYRDAHIAEHGTWEENAQKKREEAAAAEGQMTEEDRQQKALRDQITAEKIINDRFGGGPMGLSQMSDDEKLREQGRVMQRMIDIGYRTPEDYGLTQEQWEDFTEDKVQQVFEKEKARDDQIQAAIDSGQIAPQQKEEEVQSRWRVLGRALKTLPTRFTQKIIAGQKDQEAGEVGLEKAGEAYMRNISETHEEIGDEAKLFLQDRADKFGVDLPTYYEMAAQQVQDAADYATEELRMSAEMDQEAYEGLPQIENFTDNPLGYLANLAVQNTDSAAYMTVGFMTRSPVVLAGLMGTDVYTRKYTESRMEGRSRDEATMDATYSAAIEGATEGIPLSRLLKRSGASMSRRRKILEAMRDEALQEMAVSALQMGYDAKVLDKDMTVGEALIELRDSAMVGAMFGSAIATPTAITGDFEMSNANERVKEATGELQSIMTRVQNPNERVGGKEVQAAKAAYVDAIKARKELIDKREEAAKEKAKAKQQKKTEKARKKMTPTERKRDIAREQQAKADQTLTEAPTESDLDMASTMDRIIQGTVTEDDADAVAALLDAGYARVMPSGKVAVLPAGRRRLKAVREAEAVPEPVETVQDEVIEPVPFESTQRRQEREARDAAVERVRAGEETITPQPYKTPERRKAELEARVDKSINDPKVISKIADDIIKGDQVAEAYEKREAERAVEADKQRDKDYQKALNQQNEVDAELAINLARLDEQAKAPGGGTSLGKVLRNAMNVLEREEAKAKAALEDAFWNKPVQGQLFDVGQVLAKGTKDYANVVKIGALKIAKVGLKYSAWSADMIAEFGDNIRPVIAKVWHDAKKRVRDVMRISHEKFETGKRKGELKYSPKKYAKPGKIQQLRRTLEKLAKEGERGRFWYEKSGKEILRATGGNKTEARLLAGLLAIYSSGTAVSANLTNALKMWSQWKAGNLEMPRQGTKAGRFGEQDRTALEWLQSKESDEYFVEKFGDKRFPFFTNLMREIDPENYELGQGATIDLWMMRAFGYDRATPTTAQFAFATTEIKNLADRLGWEKQQVQAAVWVAIKARWEFIQKQAKQAAAARGYAEISKGAKGAEVFEVVGNTREEQIENEKKVIELFREIALRQSVNTINDKLDQSKADFADYMQEQYATISWEAEPTTKLNLNFDKMPIEAKIAMQAEIAAILTNPETGREFLAERLGLLGQNQFIGPGSWNMSVGSTVQNSVLAPTEHKGSAAKVKKIQAESASALDGYAAIVGFLLKQDAVAWHRPFYSASMKASNGIEIIGPNLDHVKTIDLYSQIVAVAEANGIPYETAVNWAPVVMDGSVRVFNFEDATGVQNRAFHKIVEQAANAAKINGAIELFQSDGGLISNDWTTDKKGEGYVNQIRNSENPLVEETFEWAKRRFAREIAAVYEKYADKYGRVEFGQKPVSAPLSLGAVVQGGEAAAIELGTRFGTVEPGTDTNAEMRIYNLDRLVDNKELQEQMAREFGYEVKYFSFEENPELGVEFVIPKLKKQGYEQNVVWIYDPRNSAGSFKGAVEYTRAWRISHEIGHAVAERFMQEKYGDSRRYGRLGRTHMVTRGKPGKQVQVEEKPLTLKEAQRAVEWEDVAFRVQREILQAYGIEITNEQFAEEFNINISDALFRVLTGEFNDPGDRGFRPASREVSVKGALKLLEEAEAQLAEAQGRKPTKGVDLSKWRRTPISSLRAAINQRRKDIGIDAKFQIADSAPVIKVKENEFDEFEVREKNGEIYYTEDADDAINTARRIYGSDVTVEIVDEFGDVIVTEEATPQPVKVTLGRTGAPEETLDKQAAVNEFMEEFIEETDSNPLTAERIFAGQSAVELSPRGGEIWLDSIRSFERGEGHGSQALEMILELADKHGVTVNLFAVAYGDGGLEQSDLVTWYERNGFVSDGGKKWVRVPQNNNQPFAKFQSRELSAVGKMARARVDREMGKVAEARETVRQQREQAVGRGIPVTQAKKFADRFAQKIGLSNVQVVENAYDLPSEVVQQIAQFGLGAKVTGLFHEHPTDGPTIYVVANNMFDPETGLPNPDALLTGLLHETIGHFGLRAMLGTKDYNRVMDLIRRDMPADVKRRGANMSNTAYGKRLAAEEVIAYTAQEELKGMDLTKLQTSLLDRVIAAIKLKLAEWGWREFSRDDILNLIFRAADFTTKHDEAFLQKRALQVEAMREAEWAAENYKFQIIDDPRMRNRVRDQVDDLNVEIDTLQGEIEHFEIFAGTLANEIAGSDYASLIEAGDFGWMDDAKLEQIMSQSLFSGRLARDSEFRFKKGFILGRTGKKTSPEKLAQQFRDLLPGYYDRQQQLIDAQDRLNRLEKMHNIETKADGLTPKFSLLEKERKNDPELDRFLNKIGHGKTTKWDNLKDWWYDHKGQWKKIFEIEVLDQYAGIKHAEEQLGGFGTESGYMSVRLAAGVDVMLRSALEHGVPVWDAEGTVAIDNTEKGLVEILAQVGKNPDMLKMFEAFIVARRAKRLSKEQRERLISREEIAAAYRYIRKHKLYKLFDSTQKEMAAYKKRVLDFAEEAGLIDSETRPTWEHADHVPFYRVLAKDKTGPFVGSRIGQAGSVVKRLRGGTEYLKNPLESIVQNIGFLIESSVKNRAIGDVIRNFDGTGIVTKAPQAEMSTALVPMDQIQDMLDEAGVSIDSLGRDMLTGIRKLMSLQAPTGDNVVSVQDNGKRQYYYIHDTGIMRGLEVQPRNWEFLMRPLRAPKRILTRAITLTPDFILKNWFRDMWHTWTLSRIPGYVGVVPGIDSTKGWAAAIAQNDVYKDMMAGGGMFDSGYVNASDPNKTNIAMRKALLGAGRSNILDSPRKLARFYMRIANGAENAHRVAIYQKTLERTGSRKQALFESRDIMDFAVRGANPIVRFLTETVPFWGARVQGLSRSAKSFKEAPLMTFLRGAPIMLASVALYAMNREDERYKGLAEYEKRMYYHFYDVFEDGDHWRLPKPFEVGAIFGSIPEILTEATLSDEPDKGRALAHSMYFIVREMLMLSPDVQAVNPLYELAINENRFTESPILTDWEKKKDPRQQYSYRTNKTVRELAHMMPDWAPDVMRSPKQLEHIVRGYFGSMMDYALVASDMLYAEMHQDEAQPPTMRWDETPFMRAFRRDTPAKYDIYLDTMYSVLEEADKIHNSINDLKKQGDREGIREYREDHAALLYARGPMNRARQKLRDVNNNIRRVYESERYTPEEKREKIDELLKRRSDIAKGVYDYRPGGKLNPEEGLLEGIIGKNQKEQVDALVAAQLPHTAILVNDITISAEKLQDVA